MDHVQNLDALTRSLLKKYSTFQSVAVQCQGLSLYLGPSWTNQDQDQRISDEVQIRKRVRKVCFITVFKIYLYRIFKNDLENCFESICVNCVNINVFQGTIMIWNFLQDLPVLLDRVTTNIAVYGLKLNIRKPNGCRSARVRLLMELFKYRTN